MSNLSNTKLFFVLFIFIFSVSFAQGTKEYEESFSLDKNGTVSIDTYKGSIKVETWDKAEVHFRAVVEPDADGWNNTDPEEQLERCEVRSRHSDDYLRLESDYEKDFVGSQTLAFVHYTIKMPATAKLQIDDYKSKTHIRDLHSDLMLETYKGIVNIVDYSGKLELETYKGSVEVDFTEIKNDCEFDTYKGDITLFIPDSEKFDFDFEIDRKGDFDSDFEMMMRNYSSDDGDIRGSVNGGGPVIEFSTYKGEINLRKR